MYLQRSRNKTNSLLFFILPTLSVCLISFGYWGVWQWWQATHNSDQTIPSRTITHSTNKPSETRPLCNDNYKVPASQPRKIEIPSLNKTGCIQKVGIDQEGAIAVPTNIHTAGWYVGSVVPGDAGVSIIDGHVSGRYESNAIFSNIKSLKKGDVVKVQLGDKSWRGFSILDINSYPVEQTTKEQFRQLKGVDEQLTLVTCGGSFNTTSQQYDQRVVVRAKTQ